MDIHMKYDINPVTRLDYPDVDVIRVEDTYYMISTTMHFMPGGTILRSFDLLNWEHASYVFHTLDSTKSQRLEERENIYGKGMWAASLRYHKGIYYVCFVANDTGKTYLYTSTQIEGPWKKNTIEGFYHDCSLFFEENRVYIIYGNREIYLTELDCELKGPLEGGIHRLIVNDEGHPGLGYEGSHFYKINEKYYVFFIHSLREQWRRVEACFVSDSLTGEFIGGDVLNDDIGYCNQGVAQGGIVDTPEGKWYGVLFQDRGAVGRIPVLVPVIFENDYPVFGNRGSIPDKFELHSTRPNHKYEPLTSSDDFRQVGDSFGFRSIWQFNHEPQLELVELNAEEGFFRVQSGKLCANLTQAKNTLTQRMCYPGCTGEVTLDGSGLKEGDYAGIAALQGCYGFIALTKRQGRYFIVMKSREADNESIQGMDEDSSGGIEWETILVQNSKVRLKLEVDFTNMKDTAIFYYQEGKLWKRLGIEHKLYFKLDHFTGCRFGLFLYSTEHIGGKAICSDFVYGNK